MDETLRDDIAIDGTIQFLEASIRTYTGNGDGLSIGDTYAFLTADAVEGQIDLGFGLWGWGDGLKFFEVVPSEAAFSLEVKPIQGNGDFLPEVLNDEADLFGMFISDYFSDEPITLLGDFFLGRSLGVSGGFYLEKVGNASNDVILSVTDDVAELRTGDNVVRATGIDGVGYMTFEGVSTNMHATGISLEGVDALTLVGESTPIILNSIADQVSYTFSVLGQEYTVAYDQLETSLYLGGWMVGEVTDLFLIEGEFRFTKEEPGRDTPISSLAKNVRVGLGAGPFFVGIESVDDVPNFGLILHSDDTFVFYGDGQFVLDIGDEFSIEDPPIATVLYNNTDADVARTVRVGDFSVDLDVRAGEIAVSVVNLNIDIDGIGRLSGDFGFSKRGGNIEAVATDANIVVEAGDSRFGIEEGNMGLIVNDDETVALEVSGNPVAVTGQGIDLVNFETIIVRMNSTGQEYTGQTLDIGRASYTWRDLPAGTDLKEVAILGADMRLGDVLEVQGDFALQSATRSVQLADGQQVETDSITFGASNVSGFVGNHRGTADEQGLAFENIELAIAYFTPKADEVAYQGYQWLAVQGSADALALVGTSDGFELSAQDVALDLNLVFGATEDDTEVIDFISDGTDVEVLVGSFRVPIVLDGALGVLVRFQGVAHIVIDDYIELDGGIGIERSGRDVILNDGVTTLSTDAYLIGGSGLTGFVGIKDEAGEPETGLALSGVTFGLGYFVGEVDGESKQWLALKSQAESSEIIGADTASGFDVAFYDTVVDLNLPLSAGDPRVIDFMAVPVNVPTGVEPVQLDFDGADGTLVRTLTGVDLAVESFFFLDGHVGFSTELETVRLRNGTEINTRLFTLGALDVNAFIGVGGPVDQDGAVGLALTGVDFAFAVQSAVDPGDDRAWTSLKASVDGATFLGANDGEFSINASDLSIEINGAAHDQSIIDYASHPLAVPTGADPILLDFDGDRGVLVQAGGTVQMALSNLMTLEGSFAFSNLRREIHLSDGSSLDARLFQVAATDLSAFVGTINGDNKVGFDVTDLDFGMTVAKPVEAADARRWMALKAHGKQFALVGLEDVSATVNELDVVLNTQLGDLDDTVLDLDDAPLELTAGSQTVLLDHDGARGALLGVQAGMQLVVLDNVALSGQWFLTKESYQLPTQMGETVDTELLVLGASNLSGVAGVGVTTEDPLGFAISDVNFALAIATSTEVDDARSWTMMQAHVGNAQWLGGEANGFTAELSDFNLLLNTVSSQNDLEVADLNENPLEVPTQWATWIFDFDGDLGIQFLIESNAVLEIQDLIRVEGNIQVQSRTETFILSDGSSVEASTLTLAATGVQAFAGVWDASTGEGVSGFELNQMDFGLLVARESLSDSPRTWTALQASAGSAQVVGIGGDDFQLGIQDAVVRVNTEASDQTVLDLSAAPRMLEFGGQTLTLDLDGADGAQTRVAGRVNLEIGGFVSLHGAAFLETFTHDLELSNGESVSTRALLLGVGGMNGFAGLNGPADSGNAIVCDKAT